MKLLHTFLIIIASALAGPTLNLKNSLSSKVVGGRDANPGEFPFIVSYQWKSDPLDIFQHICGGSIISSTWIVTAGHCITDVPNFGEFKIVAGINNLRKDQGQEINVIKQIVNPNFPGRVAPNDIALLQLENPLTFNINVQAIALSNDVNPERNAVLSGWGSVGLPTQPDMLQTAELPIVDINQCKNAIDLNLNGGDNHLDLDLNICTGPLNGGYSACLGDSGGPLVQNGTLIGIVSWGIIPCASINAPSVYTKVSAFIDYINDNIKNSSKYI